MAASEEDKVYFPSGMGQATSVKSGDKIMLADADTGKTKVADFDQAKTYLNITGIEVKAVAGGGTEATAVVLSPGPDGQVRKMSGVIGWFKNAGGTPWLAPTTNDNSNWWDGTAWSLGSSVPLPVDPNSVKKDEVVGEASSNIYNYAADTNNFYINNTGDKVSNTGAKMGVITLTAGQTHVTFKLDKDPAQAVNKYYGFYDTSDVKLTYGVANSNANPTASVTVAIPTGATKLYFTTKNTNEVDTIRPKHMVNYGQTALPFIPYNGSLSKVGDKSLADYAKKSEVATPALVDQKIGELDIPTVDTGEITSNNLADPSHIMNGLVSTTSGAGTQANASWRMIWIPCTGNEDFAIGGWNGVSSGIGFFSGPYPTTANNTTNIISSGTAGSQGITRVGDTVKFKTPAACTWWVITLKNATETSSVYANLMIAKGTVVLPYEPFGNVPLVDGVNGNQIATSYIKVGNEFIESKEIALKSDIKPIVSAGEFAYEYDSAKTLSLIYGNDRIVGLLGKNLGYTRNNVFDFQNFNIAGINQTLGDEAAPVHAMNYTLGANHGGRSWLATIASHGLTNLDIGTLFVQSGGTFVLARIVGASQLQFISQNIGTFESPAWNNLDVGIISRGGTDFTITAIDTSVQNQQIYPSIKNHIRKLFVDGLEVEAGVSGNAKKVEVHESYEIKIVESIYNNLVARAGTSADPTFDGDAFMKVDNIYRFTPGKSCLVLCKYSQLVNTAFSDIMATQSAPIGPVSSVQYYVPNSNPLNASVDLRKPTTIAWSASIPSTSVNVGSSPDPSNPPHRVIQYRGNVGYMTGYLKDRGVGKDITNYTNVMFELRNNTGKIYPHPVEDVKVGDPLLAGNIFSIGMYRVYTDLSKTRVGNRLSVFTVPVEDYLMVYVDYSGSMSDNINIADFDLSGKNIEVVESKNTVLKSDMYTNGFDVNATYVEGETCYIIVKIG